jgi:hypothetical protein
MESPLAEWRAWVVVLVMVVLHFGGMPQAAAKSRTPDRRELGAIGVC